MIVHFPPNKDCPMRYPVRVLLVIAFVAGSAVAQEPAGLQMSGYVHTDTRADIYGKQDFSWQEYRLDLSGTAKIVEQARAFWDLWLRYIDQPRVTRSSDLFSIDNVSPLNIQLREAYFDLYGLFWKRVDLRIGRQRFAWGTGDRINPTDNLNADDIEDIWDFGRKLGADGVKATVYFSDFSLQAGVVPFFQPALLPRGDWASVLISSPLALPEGISIGNMIDNIEMPAASPDQSTQGAVRATAKLFGYDLSLSYAYVRDKLPAIRQVTITSLDVTMLSPLAAEIGIKADLFYPRMHVAGIDFAGALGDVGIRGEGALFYAGKIAAPVSLSDSLASTIVGAIMAASPLLQPVVILKDRAYFKFVLGADYTFRNNIYINAQFVHGFFHERGDSLKDYLIFDAKWDGFDNKLTLKPVSVAIEIDDWKKINDAYALIWLPEISYHPFSNAELALGAHIIQGTSLSMFGKARELDEGYLRMKYSF